MSEDEMELLREIISFNLANYSVSMTVHITHS